MAATRSRTRRPPKTTVIRRETTRAVVLPNLDDEDYVPAYRYGVLVADKHGKKEFAEVEPLLAEGWAAARGPSGPDWNRARTAVQDGYAGVVRVQSVKTAPAKARREAGSSAGRTRKGAGAKRAATTGRKAAPRRRSGGDNLAKRGPQDRARVNVSEQWEVDYWCERLGVTPAQLKRAVKSAGPMAKDVRRELKK